MLRRRPPHRRAAAPLLAAVIALAAAPAAAEPVLLADGAANLALYDTSDAGRRATTDLRAALALELPSRRTTTRLGYSVTAALTLVDPHGNRTAYSNEVFVATRTDLSPRSALNLGASATQGTTELRLTQRAPESGQPTFRTTANTDLVSGVANESYVYEESGELRLRQSLAASIMAPRDALQRSNSNIVAAFGLEHRRRIQAFGFELRSAASSLHRTTAIADNEQYWNVRNALLARWNRDVGPNLLVRASAGVEQTLTMVDSYPLAVIPTGEASLLYATASAGLQVDASYGTAVDLLTGSVTLTRGIYARAATSVPFRYPLSLGASSGWRHAEPLGQARARIGAGTGDVVLADAGAVLTFSTRFVASIRYTISYQYNQPPPLVPVRTQVVLAGLTMQYGTAGARPFAPAFLQGADEVPASAREEERR